MVELKQSIKEKIEELSFANYEGLVQGLLIIVIDKGSFKIMPAYDNSNAALINVALDLAKVELMQTIRKGVTEDKPNDHT